MVSFPHAAPPLLSPIRATCPAHLIVAIYLYEYTIICLCWWYLHGLHIFLHRQDGAASIVSRLNYRGIILDFLTKARSFCLLQSMYIRSETHPSSYLRGTVSLFSRGIAGRCKAILPTHGEEYVQPYLHSFTCLPDMQKDIFASLTFPPCINLYICVSNIRVQLHSRHKSYNTHKINKKCI